MTLPDILSKDTRTEFVWNNEAWVCHYRDSDHSYWIGPVAAEPLGKRDYRYPGVSTIAGVGYSDPTALMKHAVKLERLGKDFEAERELSAAWGTAAHDQLEALVRTGKPLDPEGQPEHVQGCLEGVAKWQEKWTPEFRESEVVVCSPRLRVAGRYDLKAIFGGRLAMVDLKTTAADNDWSRWSRYKARSAFAQLAGYDLCEQDMLPDSAPIEDRYILLVNAAGQFWFKRDRAPDLSEMSFENKLATYRGEQKWEREHKRLGRAMKDAA